jgi:long-chain fatty acid transport protein
MTACRIAVRQTSMGLLALLFTVMSAASASAQGIYISSGGTVNRSMAGASTAAPVDAMSALYWNPSSISGMEKSEIGFSLEALFNDLDISSSAFGGAGHTESDGGVTPIPAIGWVHRVEDSNVTIGLGVFAVAGFSTNYPADATNPILAPQSNVPAGLGGFGRLASEAQFLEITPAISVQVTENIAIGGGPTVTIGKISAAPFAFGAPDDADMSMQPRYPNSVASRNHMGVGAQLGVYYTGLECLTLGAVWKSAQYMEQFRFQSQNEVGGARFERFDLDLPMIISLGAAWHGMQNAILAIDVRYFDYENTDGFGDAGFNADGSLRGLNWDNTISVAVGGRFRVTDRVTLGLGYQYNPSPIDERDTVFNLASPLFQEHMISTGGSFNLTSCVELHVAYSYYFDATITGPINTALTGPIAGTSVTNSLSAHFASLGVSVKY